MNQLFLKLLDKIKLGFLHCMNVEELIQWNPIMIVKFLHRMIWAFLIQKILTV